MSTVRQKIYDRAGGVCECGCGKRFGSMSIAAARTVDHFLGRKNARETVESLWVLRWDCHAKKTLNRPSLSHWIHLFIRHCGRHGYANAAARALAKNEWNAAKRGAVA